MIITMQDMRRVHFCAAGVQAFFEREGWDFNDFLQNGIDSEKFLATGSVFARKCVTAAKQAQQTKGEK
ncbi:hypothetical protein A6046_06760 [[Haemophilus] ducreyi]|uniref:Uncharacterized protein n=1 Tax=Haemophilus ducreyi (strain 35000HP / ATCC 700724) TaxID=233412 RepID=Q7TTI8_HAEDU|nr:hypothetical protein [[Haemophilus] ducreyi]AAP95478.1 hypothetical protein HD_0536 [[Haemophilus] ducreyi 35000HP]AAP96360.1 hypothetical protein HD_1578 [[Haemophilus] ducreyi 35000HP]AKO36347.1 hypothetical protein RZ61_02125 [[Haemophilus] ducreyi]AKO37797.1 hypothetical protein RZ62_02130 [[Haemophilus] ducreyi]AKO39355.1 hypothetical protein RZ63_02135 [[Haemophilus] ducreyi]